MNTVLLCCTCGQGCPDICMSPYALPLGSSSSGSSCSSSWSSFEMVSGKDANQHGHFEIPCPCPPLLPHQQGQCPPQKCCPRNMKSLCHSMSLVSGDTDTIMLNNVTLWFTVGGRWKASENVMMQYHGWRWGASNTFRNSCSEHIMSALFSWSVILKHQENLPDKDKTRESERPSADILRLKAKQGKTWKVFILGNSEACA